MSMTIKTKLPFHYDYTIYQGQTWTRWFVYKDANGNAIDLTGWTVKMDIRTKKGGDLLYSLAIGTGITNGGANGTITYALTKAQTATLKDSPVYDLVLTNPAGTEAYPILEGNLVVTQRVTQ